MLALAHNNRNKPLFLKKIARAEEISEKYLSQLIIPLKSRGLITTYRGAHGGYLLAKDPAEITLKDIVEPLEGDLNLVDCLADPEICSRSTSCASKEVWQQMSGVLREFLASWTLAELKERSEKITEANRNHINYSI